MGSIVVVVGPVPEPKRTPTSGATIGSNVAALPLKMVMELPSAATPDVSPAGVTTTIVRWPTGAFEATANGTLMVAPSLLTTIDPTETPVAGDTRISEAFWKLIPLIVTGIVVPTPINCGVIESTRGAGPVTRN